MFILVMIGASVAAYTAIEPFYQATFYSVNSAHIAGATLIGALVASVADIRLNMPQKARAQQAATAPDKSPEGEQPTT